MRAQERPQESELPTSPALPGEALGAGVGVRDRGPLAPSGFTDP